MSDPLFEAFVNTELPLRSAHLNSSDVSGYDGDPNDGGAPAKLQGAPVGTWYREPTAAWWWRKSAVAAGTWQRQKSGPDRQPSTNIRTQTILYARPGGDDANMGTNPTTDAVATWDRLLDLSDRDPLRGTHIVLDGTGVDWTEADFRSLPEYWAGDGGNLDFFGAGGGVQNIFDYPLEFRAEPTMVLAITLNGGVVTAPVGGTKTVNVNEVLVPGAHVGQFIVGAGLVEYGAIIDNDASSLTVASTGTTFTGPVFIMEPSSVWTFGDPGNFFEGSIDYVAYCTTVFNGIEFDFSGAFGGPAFSSVQRLQFQLCKFNGMSVSGGGRPIIVDACDFRGNFAQNGSPIEFRSSTFRNIIWNTHGEGGNGLTGWNGCEFDGCQPIGTGNSESSLGFFLQNSRINNSTSHGVIKPGPLRVNLSNVFFENISGDCVQATNSGARLALTSCANDIPSTTGFGLRLQNGAQASASGTTLEGTLGQVSLGAVAGSTTWASAPVTDVGEAIPHFCRLF